MKNPFRYTRIERRHHPMGYRTYAAYRDWLRDDFNFRCVYCLNRERWVADQHFFHIGHVHPASSYPELALNYTNLIYTCSRCNLCKGSREVPDPTMTLHEESVTVADDGTITAQTREARLLVDVLLLNSADIREWRSTLIALSKLIDESNSPSLGEFFGYPRDLPDLAALRPPQNSTPEGIKRSHFARQLRGELSSTY